MWFLLLLIAPTLALHTQEPPVPTRSTTVTPVEGWVPVRLNHFMAYDTRTFPMRYYYNNEFAGNNIVIFVGGEWPISSGWTVGGLAHDLARSMNAGLFYTEHRFYGNTRPFGDSSLENLSFLTIDQALGDLAQFIQHVKSENFEYGRFQEAKVALVGCSYAGTMATWMRMHYPHLVDAAFSDSGPLHAQEDFPEYLEVITEAIRTQGGEACLASIEEGFQELVLMIGGTPQNGPEQVSEMFNTCTPLQTGTAFDVATFYWFGITETFAGLVQYATPGDIPEACEVLTDSSVSSAVQRLANWITSQSWTQPCIETRYTQVVANHRDTSFDADDSNMRLWTYQTCVEFGWYQTTTSRRQPFLNTVPLEYFHQMCKDFFNSDFDEKRLRHGIDRTNTFFGGFNHMPDKVVSVAGGHDPWAPMGPNSTHAHYNAPVYVVPGVSHCRAVTTLNSTQEAELERVKRAVLDHMQEFILGIRAPRDAGTAAAPASIAVLLPILYTLMQNN